MLGESFFCFFQTSDCRRESWARISDGRRDRGGEGRGEGPYGAGSSEVQTVKYKTGYKIYHILREIQPIVYNKY